MNELPPKPSSPVRLAPVGFGIAVSVLVRFGVGAVPVVSGEPLVLRWLRVVADHPVRAGLAATLLVVALRPRAASRSLPEDPGSRSSH